MSTAAFAVDDRRVPVFEKRLIEAGYKFTKKKGTGIHSTCFFLNVESDDIVKLNEVIKKAQVDSVKLKMN